MEVSWASDVNCVDGVRCWAFLGEWEELPVMNWGALQHAMGLVLR